ncbi:MAG: aminoacyl-tRNA hydrolase [Candidatus Staskawiczbacteria bacterium RIFCSPLOWO2_01_FULL_38_12b]|uniref:Peptidyl-tRNA hydrolase n=1 Tax=Candidatus Staskawiczbacteria bacterium RIFCSPLOWO2_01_FULL_38_12b TaxID=1802214 RepID=A0A1G2ICT3_9BACT|nr:MAG: aminoacyl-tRNA hydrolase [Candidatus Staskawiczbacteria bacterium RIFCSPLOWO2_01_FULL_38_12b]
MIIIVGLGNPGEKFNNTRHNAGFMAVDFFAKKNDFPEFEFSKKDNALISKKETILLVKPQTFMNESGVSVKKIVSSFKFQASSFIVVHDDIDLALGSLKIVKDRGSAGHKGVESIIKHIGNENLVRLRLGIQPLGGKPKNSESFVIKKFTKEEQATLDLVIETTAQALECFIENGLEKTMNAYN